MYFGGREDPSAFSLVFSDLYIPTFPPPTSRVKQTTPQLSDDVTVTISLFPYSSSDGNSIAVEFGDDCDVFLHLAETTQMVNGA